MSAVVKITKLNFSKAAESVTINGMGIGLAMIVEGVKELNYAYEKEKEIVDCDNEIKKVDLLIKTMDGKQIGVKETDDGIDFVVNDVNCLELQESIKKIRQRYSKHLMLYQLKSKGYTKVKEERLPNGSIRMVVEKWE